MSTDFPPDLVDVQRRCNAAWEAVEAHRKAVDAARRAETVDEDRDRPKWASAPLRPWTEVEDAEHARLMAVVRETAQARHEGLIASGLGDGYDTVQGLHAAARA